MVQTQKATYNIIDTFLMTERGIVFSGYILEGAISLGNYIEFRMLDTVLRRRIIGIEGIAYSRPNKVNTGLFIQCENKAEMEALRNWEPNDTVALIWGQID